MENIPLESEPWDSGKRGYRHLRQESGASVSDIMNQPSLQPKDTMSVTNYGYEHHEPQPSQPSYLSHPHRRVVSADHNTPFTVNDNPQATPGPSQTSKINLLGFYP